MLPWLVEPIRQLFYGDDFFEEEDEEEAAPSAAAAGPVTEELAHTSGGAVPALAAVP